MATRTKQIPAMRGFQASTRYKEGASQTFKAGDHLILSSGLAVIAAAAGANYAPTTPNYLGIALRDASGTTGAPIVVAIPDDANSTFEIPVDHASSAVTAQADEGVQCVLRHVSASEGWAARKDVTTNPAVQIVAINDQRYPIGETNGTYWVSPIAGKVHGV